MLRLVVDSAGDRMRLDRYLADHWPSATSRTVVQRLIDDGAVELDGRPARASEKLRIGQTLVVRSVEAVASTSEGTLRPEPIPLQVVHEDATLLVVNKPPGLVTHPAPGNWSGTLVNALLWHLKDAPTGLPRAGIVHRLDKDTSGLLLAAKTEPALRELSRQLKERTLARTYVALVLGHVLFDEGIMDAPIGRHATQRKMMSVRYVGGRPALTTYRVVARRTLRVIPYSVLRVQLQTGRTHQIRVHLAKLGHPVLGDLLYGHHPDSFWRTQGITRQLLHAHQMQFTHPATRQPMELTAAIPDDMISWMPKEIAVQLRARSS